MIEGQLKSARTLTSSGWAANTISSTSSITLGCSESPRRVQDCFPLSQDYYHRYEKSECRVRIKFSTAELLGIFIKIRPKENSTIILNNAITVKLCRKEFFLVLCLKIIIAAIEPSIPKKNVVAKSAFSGILEKPNLANNLSIP